MDKFGYYQIGDCRSYSKFEAQTIGNKTGLKVHWNFNDKEFIAHDWQQEPTESISELYRQRAQQIRNQYDYLVLWFSGGADSTNVLDSFIDNDIKLDEVASYVNYDATGDRFNYLNAEIYNVAVPRIEQAKQIQSDLKHTIIDLSQITLDYFNNANAKFDWIYYCNSYINPNASARQEIKLQVTRWKEMINSGKRVCFIHGVDKPRVVGINNQYFFKFIDMIDNAVSVTTQMLDRPWEFDELFYWSPSAPKIPIKQGHIIKNFLKSVTAQTPGLTTENLGLVATTIDKKMYWVNLDKINSLIYPKWKLVQYQVKPSSLIFSPRDEWFFKLSDNDPAKRAWKIGLEHRWNTSDSEFKKDKTQLKCGFRPLMSHAYSLGT